MIYLHLEIMPLPLDLMLCHMMEHHPERVPHPRGSQDIIGEVRNESIVSLPCINSHLDTLLLIVGIHYYFLEVCVFREQVVICEIECLVILAVLAQWVKQVDWALLDEAAVRELLAPVIAVLVIIVWLFDLFFEAVD